MIKLKDLLVENKIVPIKVFPSILYHATFEEFINNIIKNGLIPQKNAAQNFEESINGFVYLGDYSQRCKEVMEFLYQQSSNAPSFKTNRISSLSGKINVLTIDTKKLNKNKMFKDPKEHLLKMKSYMYQGIISPESIIDYGD